MLKDAPPEELVAAVRIVASGEALLAPAVTRAVIEEFTRHPPAPTTTPPPALQELTPREQEVLDLLARGRSNPEICQELVISEATAKTHVARILQKLDLPTAYRRSSTPTRQGSSRPAPRTDGRGGPTPSQIRREH
jgi:DNA-binding NarL/FixJ family response regulator